MQEGAALTVILFGVVLGLVTNYMAWVWILSVRRQARVNILHGNPPDEDGMSTADGE